MSQYKQAGVTSVALSVPGIFTLTGSPVTSRGTLALALASQSANQVLAAPGGSSGTPTFRVLVAGDIPNLDAAKITTGTLAQARGGTGTDTSAATDGQVLIGKSSDHSLNLATLTAGAGVTITNGAGTISVAATGSGGSWATKTANYAVQSTDSYLLGDATSGSITLTMPTAVGSTQVCTIKRKDATAGTTLSVATTSSQTIDGAASYVLYGQYESITLVSDGSNWYIA